MQLVDEFQTALLAGDERRCRKLVTEASAQALASIPWDAVAKKKPVTVQGAEPLDSGYRIAVLDPNDGGRRAEFIVVREYGRLVVDLIATAGLTAEEVMSGPATHQFEPRQLTPADYDRIRQMELQGAGR